MRKSAHKKEFYLLNVAKSGIKRVLQHDNAQEENSREKRVSLHDTRARGKVQKCTEMHTKKRN